MSPSERRERPRFTAARKCDLDCACGAKGGERCKRKGIFNQPLPCGRDAELASDPEGQEYAYRVAYTNRTHGHVWRLGARDLHDAADRHKELATEGYKAWVERALLGTWERVGQ